jgi:hypothetical protein
MEFKKIDCTKREAFLTFENWKLRNNINYEELKKQKCEICSKNSDSFHHKDGDRRNNNKSNLQRLCKDCHFKLHKTFKISYIDTNIDYYSLFNDDKEVVEKIKRWKQFLDIKDESEIIRRLILNFRM